ncbi:MAG TPA: YSC84-related protein [Bordetella sp.]
MAYSRQLFRRTGLAAATVAFAGLAFTGCTTNSQKDTGSVSNQRSEINAGADSTLSKLYQSTSQAQSLVSQAKGVLIFPSVISASFIVGGEYGKGVLREGGKPVAYYSTASGSLGFQAGAQSRATVLLFMTDDALAAFKKSQGWTVGADATVAIAKIGANGSIDTNTVKQPVVGFVLNNAGLMAGVSIDGTKITRDTAL